MRKWMPPHVRAPSISFGACESLLKLLVLPEVGLKALKAISSVSKKCCSVRVIAPLAQA